MSSAKVSLGRVLIVEDEPDISAVLVLNLQHAGFVCDTAMTARAAQEAVNKALPDLVLLDWMLPGQSGVELLKVWRQEARTRQLPVLMLTARSDEEDIVAALEAGADDYVVKPFRVQEVLARLRSLLRRASPESMGQGVRHGELLCVPSEKNLQFGATKIHLGPTEFRLLAYLLAHQNKLHSRSHLLDKVWGDHVFIEERTVDVHIKRVRAELARHGVADIIETVRGGGYRIVSTS